MQTTEPYKVMYHLFTDQIDDWFSDYGLAVEEYKLLEAEGANVRLYSETYATEVDYLNGDMSDEDYVLGFGDFPS